MRVAPPASSGLHRVAVFVSFSRLLISFAPSAMAASAVAFAYCASTLVSASRPGVPVRARVVTVFIIQCRVPLGASVVVGQTASLAVQLGRRPRMVCIVTILS